MRDILPPEGFWSIASAPPQSSFAAVLMGYNESRHVRSLLSFYAEAGLDVIYLDDGSSDETVDLVMDHLGGPVVAVYASERSDDFSMVRVLEAKEAVMRQLPHRWAMHSDMDEYRLGVGGGSLMEASMVAERMGANALNFQEYTFIPVAEDPDHDHERYRATMRWYYPFSPRPRHRMNAFIPSELPDFDLVSEAGHRVRSAYLQPYPVDLVMEHYPFLSLDHFIESYVGRVFGIDDLDRGWHGNRRELGVPELPPADRLRDLRIDGYQADPSETQHLWTMSPDGQRL